jgi:16S rRNA (cytosine1402-N4)-methyltransferase
VVLDCTIGRAGHAAALAERIGPDGTLVGFDLDPSNLEHAGARLEAMGASFTGVAQSFIGAPRFMEAHDLRADVVLADLGVSSTQIDDASRGFSFGADGPLDMRLDPAAPATAADLVASSTEAELADILWRFGEEPLARKIARIVVRNRRHMPIQTTAELARLVVEAYGRRARSSRMHPATRTFMALRIAVNDELGALAHLLDEIARGADRIDAGGWLRDGARIGIISFHSLEDRLVKRAFADLDADGRATRLTRKPVSASDEERRANPRARSARLRAIRMNAPSLQ